MCQDPQRAAGRRGEEVEVGEQKLGRKTVGQWLALHFWGTPRSLRIVNSNMAFEVL